MYSQIARYFSSRSCLPSLASRLGPMSGFPFSLAVTPISSVPRISRFSSSASGFSSTPAAEAEPAPTTTATPNIVGRLDPKTFDISAAIDGFLAFEHRDVPLFPKYMHQELKPRVIANVRSRVNLLRSQGVKVPKAKMDEILVDEMLNEGAALARTEEDRVHLLMSEAPRIGDKHEVEGKPATVVRRFLVTEDVMQLVVESEVAPPSDQMVRQFYLVHDHDKPAPEMDEAEKERRVKQITAQHMAAVQQGAQGSRADRVGFSDHDIDRALHEKLLGKEHPDPEKQTEEEKTQTRKDLEEAMMKQLQREDEAFMKNRKEGPPPTGDELKLQDLLRPDDLQKETKPK